MSAFMQPFTVAHSASDIVSPHRLYIHISMNAQGGRKTQISECRETVNSHILKSIDWRTDRTPCQVLGEKKEWIGNKTKMLDRAQVEGTGGSDKGGEVNSGKHAIEREMGRRTEEG